jgi:CheY-like chemotaxis protein
MIDKLLWIDDDLADLRFMTTILEEKTELLQAIDTDEAFRYLRSEEAKSIELIIMDSIMPYGATRRTQDPDTYYSLGETSNGRFTGVRLAESIRKSERGIAVDPDVHIIMYSNIGSSAELVSKCEPLGIECHDKSITKSISALWKLISDIKNSGETNDCE